MTWRAWVVGGLTAITLGGAGPVAAQPDGQRELAGELAQLMLDETVRRRLGEQVSAGVMRAIGATLQERLNRRLLEVEWRMLAGIVERFVEETLPRGRAEQIATEVYLRHFDAAELQELVAFQRSATGRKAARLTPVIARETSEALERELRASPAVPGMLEALHRAFPVLGPGESP